MPLALALRRRRLARAASGTQLLHKGALLTGRGRSQERRQRAAAELLAAQAAAPGFVRVERPVGLAADGSSIEQARMYMHSQASCSGRDVCLQQGAQLRHPQQRVPRARRFDERDDEHEFVGEVVRFLRVVPSQAADPDSQHEPLRLAVCRFFSRRTQHGEGSRQTLGAWHMTGGCAQSMSTA